MMRHSFWLRGRCKGLWTWTLGLVMLAGWGVSDSAVAATAKEIDVGVDVALEKFEKDVGGAKQFLTSAKGILVFPSVIKAGIGFGGEYGEGALRIDGKSVAYYNTIAGSFGFQLGAQAKTVVIAFLEQDALDKFQKSEGWKVGVDGSVAVVTLGAGTSLDTSKLNQPIVGFVLDQKGLMYNLTLEGSKFTKLNK